MEGEKDMDREKREQTVQGSAGKKKEEKERRARHAGGGGGPPPGCDARVRARWVSVRARCVRARAGVRERAGLRAVLCGRRRDFAMGGVGWGAAGGTGEGSGNARSTRARTQARSARRRRACAFCVCVCARAHYYKRSTKCFRSCDGNSGSFRDLPSV